MSAGRSPDQPPGRARLFRNGRSQAVRLPLAFRFEGDEVAIRREGDAVILEPLHRRSWPRGYWSRIEREAGLFEGFDVGPALPAGGTDVDLDQP